jgi:hypothetical protein
MQAFQIDLTKKKPALLINFIGGWIKSCLENPEEKDADIATNVSGLKSIIKVYSANRANGIKKNRKLEKLRKMTDKELEKYVLKKLE